jgi:hypothetical protein
MRFWVAMAVGHLLLAISVLWMMQHVAKVYAYGWVASMGLYGASPLMTVLTFWT